MWPDLSAPAYRVAVNRVMNRGVLSPGPEVRALEIEFGRYLGSHYCVAVPSGTAALEALLRVYGIGRGHEVIVPAMTFTATALAVLAVGAEPVFADVDDTWGLSPESAERIISPRTKAIIPVDMHGNPADYAPLLALASRYGLTLLEDACPAYGAFYAEHPCGTFGAGAAFSFNSGKMCPAGEGGMVVVPTKQIAEEVRQLAFFGEPSATGAFRMSERYGTNWKMPELTAAVARVSLEAIEGTVRRGLVNATTFYDVMARDVLGPALAHPTAFRAFHKLRLRNVSGLPRTWVEDHLEASGVPISRQEVHLLPRHPVFRGYRADQFPGAIEALRNTIVVGTPTTPIFGIPEETAAAWAAATQQIKEYV